MWGGAGREGRKKEGRKKERESKIVNCYHLGNLGEGYPGIFCAIPTLRQKTSF